MNSVIDNELELRKRLENDTSKNNILLLAGAGSGKTTFIVQNILAQIETGVPVEKIVAISFTNKAAGKLRNDIFEKLNKIENKSENVIKAINNFSLMQISTIHSFCYKILTQNALYAKLPVDLKLIDENEEVKRQNDFFNNYLEQHKPLDHYKFYFLNDKVYNLTKENFSNIICHGTDKNLEMMSFNKNISLDEDDIIKNIRVLLNDINVKKLNDPNVKDLNYNKNFDFIRDLKKIDNMVLLKKIKEIKKKNFRNIINETNPNGKNFNKIVSLLPIMELYSQCVEIELYNVMCVIKDVFNAYKDFINTKEEIKRISQNRLIERTSDLLDSLNTEDLNKIRKPYEVVYLDEAQDTDYKQINIINKICAIGEDNEKNHKLVVVGDPKQSIYAFRGADLNSFKELQNELSNGNNKYLLNFRSNKSIIDFVNNNFNNIFIKQFGYYDNMLLNPKKSTLFESRLLNGVYKSGSDDPVYLAINTIKTLINNKYKITKYDDENKRTYIDEIKYSDFMIIIKDNDYDNAVCDRLKQSGIPTLAMTSIEQKNNIYLETIKGLFAFLMDPSNKEKRYIACQLLEKKLLNEDNQLEALSLLDNLYANTCNMSIFGKLEFLFKHYDYLLVNYVPKDILLSIQLNLENIFETILESNPLTGEDVITCIDSIINGTISYDIKLDDNYNAVKVINAHKTKGLDEYIVIVLSTMREKEKEVKYYKDKFTIYPLGLSEKNYKKTLFYSFDILKDDNIINKAKQNNVEEKKRLDYVVLTRAKEAIIYLYNSDNGVEGWLHEYFENDDVKELQIELSGYEYSKNKRTLVMLSPSELEEPLPVEKINNLENNAVNENSNIPNGKIFGTCMHRALELLINNLKEYQSKNSFKPYIYQALNELYEDINKDGDHTIEKYIQELEKILTTFINSAYYSLLINSKHFETEYPFTIKTSLAEISEFSHSLEQRIKEIKSDLIKDEDQKICINGFIDLIIIDDNNQITIVDYKSDLNSSNLEFSEYLNNIHKKYDFQQELYAYVIKKLFNSNNQNIRYKEYFTRYSK